MMAITRKLRQEIAASLEELSDSLRRSSKGTLHVEADADAEKNKGVTNDSELESPTISFPWKRTC
jgi:hypothetical protein